MLYIDITRLYNSQHHAQRLTGVDRVSIAYIRQFGEQSCAVIRYPKYWLFLPFKLSQTLFYQLLNQIPIHFNRNRWVKKINQNRYAKPLQQGGQNFLLHTYHGGLEKPEFMVFMKQYQLKGIYFLHDLIPIDYPEYCRDGEKSKHEIRLITMAQGELVICNSRYTLARWQAYCHAHQLTLPLTIWAHLAADQHWMRLTHPQTSHPLVVNLLPKRPYFVILGTIEARKNHLLLLAVWRMLLQEMGADCPQLFIIGRRGWECEQVFDVLDRSSELRPVITELNHCSDDMLPSILAQAQALLFPSFVEGFGLPLLEALYANIPVLASDIPAFQEIGTADMLRLSPYDTVAWKQAIMGFCQSFTINEPPSNKENVQQTTTINLPTWQQHFEKVTPVLSAILH